MRCKFDDEELEPGDGDLKNDPKWGWVHRKDGIWHTLGGMYLLNKDGNLQAPKYPVVEAPAYRVPLEPDPDAPRDQRP
jgi:hypothetical protein